MQHIRAKAPFRLPPFIRSLPCGWWRGPEFVYNIVTYLPTNSTVLRGSPWSDIFQNVCRVTFCFLPWIAQ